MTMTLPNLPAIPKAPFFKPGTMTTHAALSSKSPGMPLSGVFMISVKTSDARPNRFTSSDPSLLIVASEAEEMISSETHAAKKYFIDCTSVEISRSQTYLYSTSLGSKLSGKPQVKGGGSMGDLS